MATIDIGKIKPVFKGTYDNSTAYVLDDIVYYNGSSYVAKTSTTGNLPTDTTKWNILASGSGGIWNSSLSLGSASQQLRVNSGASALEFYTPTPVAQNIDVVSYVVLDSTGVNTIDITTNWATNNYYKMEMFMQYQMDANQGSKFRFRSSGGAVSNDTYQYLGTSNYVNQDHGNAVNGHLYDLNGSRTNTEINGWGFNSGEMNPHWKAEIYKPDPNNRQFIYYRYFNSDQSSPQFYHALYHWNVWNNDTATKTGWQVYGNNSAKFKTGFYVILGYKYQ